MGRSLEVSHLEGHLNIGVWRHFRLLDEILAVVLEIEHCQLDLSTSSAEGSSIELGAVFKRLRIPRVLRGAYRSLLPVIQVELHRFHTRWWRRRLLCK